MASTILPDRRALASLDSNSAVLGFSPTKRQVEKPGTPASSVAVEDDRLIISGGEIGLRPAGDYSLDGYSHIIVSSRGVPLLFGRARNPLEESAPQQSSIGSQSLASSRACRISLPRSAKHVSRDHAVIFHSPFGNTWAIKILGQNGLIIDGKRRRAGLVLKLFPLKSSIDFFGVKCLFFGNSQREVLRGRTASASPVKQVQRKGMSPTKKVQAVRATLGDEAMLSTESILASPLQRHVPVSVSPAKRKWVGNPLKRPLGAPPSPPTSSPAPLAHSSPSRRNEKSHLNLVPSSSPVPNQKEEGRGGDVDDDDDSSDEDYEDRGSPSLSRKGARHDDSGMLLTDRHDSEEEASQALALDRASTPAVAGREDAFENESDSSQPTTPTRNKESKKQVKFITQHDDDQVAKVYNAEIAVPQTAPASPPRPILSPIQSAQSHLRGLVSKLAETYDVQGLLAGAIVFHRTATISATEAVRSVLTSNPGMLRGEVGPGGGSEKGKSLHGWTLEQMTDDGLLNGGDIDKERIDLWQRKAWREKLEECLLEGDCFGIISRAGKDASGNPLEYWYYYDKDRDPDLERAANLGALAKPMRAALKTHKPIFWKKSAYGHANSSDSSKADGAASNGLATESQWGSSGSTLDSLLFCRPADASNTKSGRGAEVPTASWEETQYEEREKTWDRVGDDDFEVKAAKKIRRRR